MLKKGDRYGRLVATGGYKTIKQNSGKRIGYGEFICDCGNKVWKRTSDVFRGRTSSCGCFRKDNTSEMFTTHGCCKGHTHNKLYRAYCGVRDRCTNKNNEYYKDYGGRGIKCRWKDFEEFKYDMESSLEEHIKIYGEKNTTIDRIDVNGDYYKENCRWCTYKRQANNTRRNRYEMWNGKKMSITDIYYISNSPVSYTAFYSRYYKLKWPLIDCLYKPPHTLTKKVLNNKKTTNGILMDV